MLRSPTPQSPALGHARIRVQALEGGFEVGGDISRRRDAVRHAHLTRVSSRQLRSARRISPFVCIFLALRARWRPMRPVQTTSSRQAAQMCTIARSPTRSSFLRDTMYTALRTCIRAPTQ